jgi:hypothetical protein
MQNEMNAQNGSNKKRKLSNKIYGGIHNPSLYVDKIEFNDGKLHFSCPSKHLPDATHKIELNIIEGKMEFECSCSGGYEDRKSKHCGHIESVIINMCTKYIDDACEFIDEKDKYMNTKRILNKLAEEIDSMLL